MNIFEQKSASNLGKSIISWTYTPKFSDRLWLIVLTVVGILLAVSVYFGDNFIPWLDRIPDIAIYLVILLIGPVFNYIKSVGKKQHWTLYEYGFAAQYSKGGKDEKIGYWSDYKTAEYNATRIFLIPVNVWTRRQRIPAAMNAMEIFSICRERIGLAQVTRLHSGRRSPAAPNTPEQRRAAMYERRSKNNSFNWKDIFKE